MSLDATLAGANANTYVLVADADAYFVARGNAAWAAASNGVKEAALLKATQYLDSYYEYQGVKQTRAQALQWPRSWVSIDGYIQDAGTLPKRLTDACCELALRNISADIAPDIETKLTTSETVGPISVTYAQSQRNAGRKTFDFVDALVAKLTVNGSRGSVAMVRG